MIEERHQVYRKPQRFTSVPVPFVTFGNERALTSLQLANDTYLADFFSAFSHCFKYDPLRDIWLYHPI